MAANPARGPRDIANNANPGAPLGLGPGLVFHSLIGFFHSFPVRAVRPPRRIRGYTALRSIATQHESTFSTSPCPVFRSVCLDEVSQASEEALAVAVVTEDGAALVAADGDVIDGAFIFDAKRSGHRRGLRNHELTINPKVQN